MISMKNPKISYLVDTLFQMSKKNYLDYILNIGISSPHKKSKLCEEDHNFRVNIFSIAINNFLEHKDINLLFNEEYYLENNNETWDNLNDMFFDEDENHF